MPQEGGGRRGGLLLRARALDAQALAVVGPVVARHEGVLVGAAGRADIHLDARAGQAADERPRKVAAGVRPDEARVAVDRDALGPAVLPQQVQHPRQGGLGSEVGANLGVEQDGGLHVDGVERPDAVLLLARGVRRDGGDVIEADLPGRERRRAVERLVAARRRVGDPPVPVQGLPDRAGGARQPLAPRDQVGVAVQVVADRAGARDPPQLLRRLVADGEAPRHHRVADPRRRVPAGPRAAVQDAVVACGAVPQAAAPLLDRPSERPRCSAIRRLDHWGWARNTSRRRHRSAYHCGLDPNARTAETLGVSPGGGVRDGQVDAPTV